jgi:nifR3 family TIM-barrel protein
MLRIGAVTSDNWLVMAPMAGITNLPFRLMVKRLGAGLVFTEMISAKGLTLRQKRTLDYLEHHPEEGTLAVQIFGDQPDIMAAAAEMVVGAGADIVDINMGCPVKKVVKTGAGGALLKTPGKVRAIFQAVRQACPVPLTAKMRAGWSPGQPSSLEIARVVQEEGADAITLHPRFVSQGYSGKADWTLIADFKAKLEIPIIGNGDVFAPRQAIEMKHKTGCNGVMIGRAAVGNPWIFGQVLDLEQGRPVFQPKPSQRRALILEHFHLLMDRVGERRAALVMRDLLLRYTKGLPHSNRFRARITQIKDLHSLVGVTDDYFSTLEEGLS